VFTQFWRRVGSTKSEPRGATTRACGLRLHSDHLLSSVRLHSTRFKSHVLFHRHRSVFSKGLPHPLSRRAGDEIGWGTYVSSTPPAVQEIYMSLIIETVAQMRKTRTRTKRQRTMATARKVAVQVTTPFKKFFAVSSTESYPPAVRPTGRSSLIRMNPGCPSDRSSSLHLVRLRTVDANLSSCVAAELKDVTAGASHLRFTLSEGGPEVGIMHLHGCSSSASISTCGCCSQNRSRCRAGRFRRSRRWVVHNTGNQSRR
jgi:hypothetical protein